MFDIGNKRENGEKQNDSLSLLHALEELDKEVQLLRGEKENLLDIEDKLWVMVREDIVYKRRKNQELQMENEQTKKNCIMLAKGFNSSIRKDLPHNVS